MHMSQLSFHANDFKGLYIHVLLKFGLGVSVGAGCNRLLNRLYHMTSRLGEK